MLLISQGDSMAVELSGKSVDVFEGRLMSPREVQEATSDKAVPTDYSRRWHLCGDVNARFFELCLAGNSPGFGVGVFKSPGGAVFASFVLQLLNQQARFLLPH